MVLLGDSHTVVFGSSLRMTIWSMFVFHSMMATCWFRPPGCALAIPSGPGALQYVGHNDGGRAGGLQREALAARGFAAKTGARGPEEEQTIT